MQAREGGINGNCRKREVMDVGRKRKMTARMLDKRIKEYFEGITSERPMLRMVPALKEDADGKLCEVLDEFGHTKMVFEPVIAKNGKQAMETIWIRPPSIIDLCLHLGVDRTTFYRWCNPDEPEGETEEFCNIATRARGRIEAYLTARTEDKNAARGAIANLEANFGWKRKREVGLDEKTQRAVAMASMTTEDKLAALREMGISMPFDDDGKEETQDDDEEIK